VKFKFHHAETKKKQSLASVKDNKEATTKFEFNLNKHLFEQKKIERTTMKMRKKISTL
jgi:hypothetical protein